MIIQDLPTIQATIPHRIIHLNNTHRAGILLLRTIRQQGPHSQAETILPVQAQATVLLRLQAVVVVPGPLLLHEVAGLVIVHPEEDRI